MPLTPTSATSPYCSPADFLLRRDIQPASQLVRDDGTAATATDLATDPTLNAMLMAASGMLESAAVQGGKYKVVDLQAMVSPPTAAGEMLKAIVADLAAHMLSERRWSAAFDTLTRYQAATQWLAQLSQGQLLLPFAESAAASVVKNLDLTQQDYRHLQLPSRRERAFGDRENRYPKQW